VASYSVTSVKSQTLGASTVDTVSFAASNAGNIAVMNRDAAATISFTYALGSATATTPTALGDECYSVPAGQTVTIAAHAYVGSVKLISAGTPAYTVSVV